MPIDLDGLVIIDLMLDSVVELCLLPDTWTERELRMLHKLHNAVLILNKLWAEEDAPSAEFIHYTKSPLSVASGYLDILQIDINPEKRALLSSEIAKLENYLKLLRSKIDYFAFHYFPCQWA